jgi:beta-lactam-binding protein with PASTA domain
VTFGAFFLIGMRVSNRARDVTVPDLRGLSTEDAKTALAEAGLELRLDQRRADSSVPADHVIEQEPQAGSTLRRQRAVRVQVSDGKQDPVVPSVVGQIARTAEIILAGEKIEVAGRVEIASNEHAPGIVVAQDPPASGQASKVTLLVNRGEVGGGFVMPDVIGAIGGRAVDVLRRRGFRVTVAEEVLYPGIPSGVVVKQTPQAGFQIRAGEPVVLEISR